MPLLDAGQLVSWTNGLLSPPLPNEDIRLVREKLGKISDYGLLTLLLAFVKSPP